MARRNQGKAREEVPSAPRAPLAFPWAPWSSLGLSLTLIHMRSCLKLEDLQLVQELGKGCENFSDLDLAKAVKFKLDVSELSESSSAVFGEIDLNSFTTQCQQHPESAQKVRSTRPLDTSMFGNQSPQVAVSHVLRGQDLNKHRFHWLSNFP